MDGLQAQACYPLTVKRDSEFYAKIGRIGGSKRSAKKTAENRKKARDAAFARWHPEGKPKEKGTPDAGN